MPSFRGIKPLLSLAAIFLLAASLTPYAPVSNLLTDTPSHFPVWILTAAAILCAAVWKLKARKTAAVFALALMASSLQIIPYLPAAAPAATAETTFKLLQVNVYTHNTNTAPLQALIAAEKPDVVMIAEINPAFAAMGRDILHDYPHQFYAADTAILSRIPLQDIPMDVSLHPRIYPQFFSADVNGRNVTLATLHTAAPPVKQALRDIQLDHLTAILASLKQESTIGDDVIFGGDINITPYAPAYKKFIRDTGLRSAREGMGLRHSWPVWLPAPWRIPIDHVLVGGDIRVVDYRVGPDVASDHLPTIAVLAIP